MDPTAVCGHLSLCRPPVSPWILRQESAGSVRGPAGEDGGQWGTSPALMWRRCSDKRSRLFRHSLAAAAGDEPGCDGRASPAWKVWKSGFRFSQFQKNEARPLLLGPCDVLGASLPLSPFYLFCCIISDFAAEVRLLCHGLSAPTETTRRLQIRDAGGAWLCRLLANGDFP